MLVFSQKLQLEHMTNKLFQVADPLWRPQAPTAPGASSKGQKLESPLSGANFDVYSWLAGYCHRLQKVFKYTLQHGL